MTAPAVALFREHFGRDPDLAASAPGRVNLLGEHTDYNGGPVLPMAITRRTTVAAGAAEEWRFVSSDGPDVVAIDVDAELRGDWTDYLTGVVRELRGIGAAPSGALLAVSSTVPIGAGLSSSAALTVGAARALSSLAGRRLDGRALAEIAFRAEHDHVGVKCGRMDQTIAALARPKHALLFETGSGEITEVPMPARVLVIETGTSHRLTGGALNDRRRECETALARLRARWPDLASLCALPHEALQEAESLLEPSLFRRVRHLVTETVRTRRAAAVLGAGDLVALGELLVAGHRSLAADYESSLPEADLIVDSAVRHGAHGARLTGAGWGGAVLVLSPPLEGRVVIRGVRRDFAAAFGQRPAAWTTRASGGVRRERV
ncbi:MAG TPA: galactokinase [Gemmatimonadales bacterium]|nr:galactokinase [Gemmatimonadales bacterium]